MLFAYYLKHRKYVNTKKKKENFVNFSETYSNNDLSALINRIIVISILFQLENYGNKIANFFSKHGLKKGDVVALLMENKPEYIGIWYGLSKLGCITACINSNLRSKSLIHCITVAAPKVLLYGKEFKQGYLIYLFYLNI